MNRRTFLWLAGGGLLLLGAIAHGFKLWGFSWPTPAVTMRVNLTHLGSGTSPSGLSWNQAFAEAMELWEDTSVFSFDTLASAADPCAGYIPNAPEDGFLHGVDFRANICGDDFGSSTLAVTLAYQQSGQTLDADILFNSHVIWDVYHGAWTTPADFRRVAVHELGHVIGLDHEDSVPAIMATYVLPGSTVEAPLADDIAGVAAIYGSDTGPGLPPIVLALEEPVAGSIKSGISNLRGWAVGLASITSLEVLVDGVSIGYVPYGGLRRDVDAVFPSYPGAENSGYSMAYNYNNLASGNHNIRVVARDNAGRSAEVTNAFQVTHFPNPFIASENSPSLGTASAGISGSEIVITNLKVENKNYRLRLTWSTATQSYAIIAIEPL